MGSLTKYEPPSWAHGRTLIMRLICEKISPELPLEQLGVCGGTHL